MPGMDGLEACRALHADPALAGVPVILMTARGRRSDADLGADAGAVDYLVKPFGPRQLVERVTAVLKRVTAPEA